MALTVKQRIRWQIPCDDMHTGPKEGVPRDVHFAMTPDLRHGLENGLRR